MKRVLRQSLASFLIDTGQIILHLAPAERCRHQIRVVDLLSLFFFFPAWIRLWISCHA